VGKIQGPFLKAAEEESFQIIAKERGLWKRYQQCPEPNFCIRGLKKLYSLLDKDCKVCPKYGNAAKNLLIFNVPCSRQRTKRELTTWPRKRA
jgi:hypothetical protein